MTENKRRNIVVTGFGPFGTHKVNASWEAVKLLREKSGSKLQQLYNIDLIIEEIPVVYDHVASRVPQIWKEYDPLFVIHVGVSHLARCLTLESKAASAGYYRRDVIEQCPDEDGATCQILDVGLDVDRICQIVKAKNNSSVCVSKDAGRYLCEFTLYQSLNIKQHRALFVHVPDLNVYSSEETECGLFSIICCVLES